MNAFERNGLFLELLHQLSFVSVFFIDYQSFGSEECIFISQVFTNVSLMETSNGC